ncbi:guanylate cyclase soluble subunit beta-2-like [Argopecten irradians]|uniref:guanylate cyclase soluble subunit beta-2-like n=1 Tax=Argopecten irradians TaxID=31199 RepID=UPI0037150E82
MYGQIHVCVRELVLEKFSQEAWDKIIEKSGFDERVDFMVFHKYLDEKTFVLIGAVCEVSGLALPAVLEVFGEYFLTYCLRHGYDKMLRTLGSDFESFIQNLDSLHALLAMSYKQIAAPSFRCETDENGQLWLHYYTIRPGLYPIVIGLVRAVARDLYQQHANVEMYKKSTEKVGEGKPQEHVIFKVTLAANKRTSVVMRVENNKQKPCTSGLLQISANQFCAALPYHIIFDKNLQIMQCGTMIQRFVENRIKPGTKVSAIFDVIHPHMNFSIDNIRMFINAVFMLEVRKAARGNCKLVLKGQMLWLDDVSHMIFLCSPRLTSLTELVEMNVFMSDIPIYDVTRELVLLNQQRIAEIDVAKKLDETTAELKKTSEALQYEKKKTETLLYQMLPQKVANELKNGKTVEAEKFSSVTILFSDIVTFTNIAAASTPLQIVSMLNNLYQRFDQCTNKHDVYKVETIGDAYMIVSGVPEENENHAREVAHFSMDMIREASNVHSPVNNNPLQIRVGIHSGPVVAGVVGLKMPRYCLFGDTVNTASRMESHGIPGRVHVSPTTYKFLEGSRYQFRDRGHIEVKGKGPMNTFFLLGTHDNLMIEPKDEYTQLPLVRTPDDEAPINGNNANHSTVQIVTDASDERKTNKEQTTTSKTQVSTSSKNKSFTCILS